MCVSRVFPQTTKGSSIRQIVVRVRTHLVWTSNLPGHFWYLRPPPYHRAENLSNRIRNTREHTPIFFTFSFKRDNNNQIQRTLSYSGYLCYPGKIYFTSTTTPTPLFSHWRKTTETIYKFIMQFKFSLATFCWFAIWLFIFLQWGSAIWTFVRNQNK